jgi:catalase
VLTAEQAIDRINAIFGAHPGCRALHAKGLTCRGSFTATPEAAGISRAAHLQGEPVPVVARLSNGSGDPAEHDAAPGVRGLAVGFELPGGERTDIVSQNQPRFPVSTPEAFMELVEAVDPGPKMVARLPWFLARHPRAARALVANSSSLKAPAAYGSIPYFAVHAYEFTNASGARRWGRYTWVPDPTITSPTRSGHDFPTSRSASTSSCRSPRTTTILTTRPRSGPATASASGSASWRSSPSTTRSPRRSSTRSG